VLSGQAKKYKVLTSILDGYVEEGKLVGRRKSFYDTTTEERENQARARAFIHLYLAATYGVLGFEEREHTITDAGGDGGIDAYHIDSDRKVIDVVQAKFRVGSDNFESKNIAPEEIAAIDLNRIMSGNTDDEYGKPYNGYIQAFIEKIQKIPDIARYGVKVTILANVKREQCVLLEKLFHGDETNIVNFDRCYGELVLPTIRGEQHYSSSLRLQMDLSNKSGKSKLSAEIETTQGTCDLTVVLVPTIEIAEVVSRYKNSLLRYNPRSYLEFREQKTNAGIRSSIEDVNTGDFAILNNGITVISDETFVNERVGSRNKAQIELVRPQIINGGQTAFTLSRIYEECEPAKRDKLFLGKEVAVRIITLPQVDEGKKVELIKSISSATNSQTAVSTTDRTASNDDNRALAEVVFKKTGMLYEPKRGEYSDAISKGYIGKSDVIDRAIFTRIMHVACGRYKLGVTKKLMKNTGGLIPEVDRDDDIDRFVKIYEIFKVIVRGRGTNNNARVVQNVAFAFFVYTLREVREDGFDPAEIAEAAGELQEMWTEFERWARKKSPEFWKKRYNKITGSKEDFFDWTGLIGSATFPEKARAYVNTLPVFS
jgi:hypothetical protein